MTAQGVVLIVAPHATALPLVDSARSPYQGSLFELLSVKPPVVLEVLPEWKHAVAVISSAATELVKPVAAGEPLFPEFVVISAVTSDGLLLLHV